MNKEEAKQKISLLVDRFKDLAQSGQLRQYKEEETKKDFILPLFEALGWEVYDKSEVSAEENISGDRVDYGFYLNERIQFYVEAKAAKEDLNKEKFANQAIQYSWNKGVTWAVLTDFENIKIFNAQDLGSYLWAKQFKDISHTDFIERFDELWLLSKESFKNNLLDKDAEKSGKKLQKISVTKKLYEDLNEARALLTEKLVAWNHDLKQDPHLVDEGVQKILDRIIFIRVAEDRGIEPQTLRPLAREWRVRFDNNKTDKLLYQSMIEKFRELDAVYNSHIFAKHPSDEWEENSNIVEDIIEKLYGQTGYYEYDFKAMSADVLGTVYEQYLGHKLARAKKDDLFGTSDVELAKDFKKRKQQGIYYTPEFIVDYIVKNTLGPALDKCKSIADLQKIKVLDPACGSGSFLIKAFDLIRKKYEDFGSSGQYVNLQILTNNLYGVDLDEQAVEIARLNLLVASLEKREKLPNLTNIKNGNSLISGSEEELKKYFGKNWRDKKPFNWEEEFPEVFKQGGFDVIIGNPPWGANIDQDVKFFEEKFPNSTKSHKDIYKIFIDKVIFLLKSNGNLGLIVPNTFLYQPRYEDIKDLINKNYNFVVNLGENIFSGVQLPSCILILKKEAGTNKYIFDLTRENRNVLSTIINSIDLVDVKKFENSKSNLIKKTDLCFDQTFLFKDAGINYQAVKIGKNEKGKSNIGDLLFYTGQQKSEKDVEYWKGSNINRYFIEENTNQFVRTNYHDFIQENQRVILNKDFFSIKPKLIWRQTASSIIATIDERGIWFGRSILGAIIKNEYKLQLNIYYALAILNSQYINYIYKQKVLETGKVFPQVKLKYLRDMPFIIGSKDEQKIIAGLVKSIIKLNKELHQSVENSNEWLRLKEEIERVNKKIDDEVYKIYGLTNEEIKIIESK